MKMSRLIYILLGTAVMASFGTPSVLAQTEGAEDGVINSPYQGDRNLTSPEQLNVPIDSNSQTPAVEGETYQTTPQSQNNETYQTPSEDGIYQTTPQTEPDNIYQTTPQPEPDEPEFGQDETDEDEFGQDEFDEDETDEDEFGQDEFDEDETDDDEFGQEDFDIDVGQPTRSGPSYVGVGANIGLGEGDTAVGEGSFAIFSKIGITPNLSARPAVLVSDDPTILLPVTFDFIPGVSRTTEDVTERVAGLSVSPYVGAGVAIATGDDAAVDFLATGGVDVPLSPQISATASVNATLFENPAVGLMLGVGYNFR